MAEHDATEGTRQIASGERGKRHYQGDERRGIREDGVGDVFREDAEDDEVVELEGATEAREQDDAPGSCGHRNTLPRSADLGV